MKIAFLLHNRYGIGGAITSTLNLAAALSDEHQVEIVSTRRDRDVPALPVDPRVSVVDLTDLREHSHLYDGDDPLAAKPAKVFPKEDSFRGKEFSRLTEVRLARYLAETDAHAVIATNPGIAICLARMGGNYIKGVQEHRFLADHSAALRKLLPEAYKKLDVVIPVSREEAENEQKALAHTGVRVRSIPNCVPVPPIAPSDSTSKIVISAGRLVPFKQYHHLIEAFAKVVAQRPDWQLRIYGGGPERAKLTTRIADLGLGNNVLLMGSSNQMEVEWPKGSIAASSSNSEALPMNIIEAMYAGLPVVSTDCDYGPREIITEGVDGHLVPVGDTDALAAQILGLIQDDERRAHMGRAAQDSARRYLPQEVAAQYHGLLNQLVADRGLPTTADWWVTPHGDIVVRLAITAGMPPVRLLCLNREAPEGAQAVRFEFQEGPSQDLTAVIPQAGCPLAEGHWDVYAESVDGQARRRLKSGVRDERGMLYAAGPRHEGPVLQSRIPFTADDGSFSIRTWVRPVHVESDSIEIADGHITVGASLWGAAMFQTPVVVAKSRQDPQKNFEVQAAQLGPDRLSFSVPCWGLAQQRTTAHDVWDLWVRLSPEVPLVRVGRFMGDFHDKKTVLQYPITVIPDTPRGRTRVRPFYTVNSELSLNAVDMES
ncbi:glycosyltransferase family 4 protein [Kitasatospora camelliae]|uniref:D-inositol 3-phosphate glycosyltransferase n=1 Tax=Kitasatospora camelliae TaxID=3156397 RepID=A0AAU8JZE0_9ACTN